jgi:hypothetical protein
LDILVYNSDEIISSANLNRSDNTEATEWFEKYAGDIDIYPSTNIAYVVFRMLFKIENAQLCLHQFEGRAGQYLNETGFQEGLHLPLENIANVSSQPKKKVHLWNCDGNTQHFEPCVLQGEQQVNYVNLKVIEWNKTAKKRLMDTGTGTGLGHKNRKIK